MINQFKVSGLSYVHLYYYCSIITIYIYILVKQNELDKFFPIMKKYIKAKEANTILTVPFTTLIDYMWLLRGSCMLMNNKNCLLYLAAAVSDFYIPPNEMVYGFIHVITFQI